MQQEQYLTIVHKSILCQKCKAFFQDQQGNSFDFMKDPALTSWQIITAYTMAQVMMPVDKNSYFIQQPV